MRVIKLLNKSSDCIILTAFSLAIWVALVGTILRKF